MEPITIASIATVVQFLANRAAGTAFDTSIEKLTERSVKWVKTLFWKDNIPEPILQRLIDKPESEGRRQAVAAMIVTDIEDNPGNAQWLKELSQALMQHSRNITISHSKNVNTGNISAGGSVTLGDN